MLIPNTVTDFAPGQRVESHPATSLWMRGVRFGTVTAVTKIRVVVQFDRLPHPTRMRPGNLQHA